MTLGDIIKKYRNDHNLSLQGFANLINSSKSYVSILENNYNPSTGKPVSPSLDTLMIIAEAMQLDLDSLLKLIDEKQPIYLNENKYLSQFSNLNLPEISIIQNPNELDFVIKDNKKLFAYRINNDEMMPLLDKTDIAIIEITDKIENCKTFLIWLENKPIIRKIIVNEDNSITLQAMNPYYPIINTTKDKIEIIGKVIKAENSSAFK